MLFSLSISPCSDLTFRFFFFPFDDQISLLSSGTCLAVMVAHAQRHDHDGLGVGAGTVRWPHGRRAKGHLPPPPCRTLLTPRSHHTVTERVSKPREQTAEHRNRTDRRDSCRKGRETRSVSQVGIQECSHETARIDYCLLAFSINRINFQKRNKGKKINS